MKIIGFIGSYRKCGNTDTAVRTVLEGALNQGAEVEAVYLNDYEIADCVGCEACKTTFECVIRDDMQKIYAKILEADGIVIGSPTYFYNVTGIIKNMIDRLYCYEIFDEEDRSVWMGIHEAAGPKYATVVAVCEQKDPEDLGYTAVTMTKSLQALGYRVVDELKIYNVYNKNDLLLDTDQLIKLEEAGMKLAKTIRLKEKILKLMNAKM